MPSFRRYGATARSRARYASRTSRRWGPRRSGFVTARALLRYRSKKRFPTVVYPGPSRETKYHDSGVKYALTSLDVVGGGLRARVPENTYKIVECRPTSIAAGSGAVERIGNVIDTKTLTVRMQFEGYKFMGTGEGGVQDLPMSHLDANHFRRTHFRWALVEDYTQPPTDENIPPFSWIYDSHITPGGTRPNENPLLNSRNVEFMGRYKVLAQGQIITDSDDPIKIKALHIPWRRRVRFETILPGSPSTNNVYLVVCAYVPFMDARVPSGAIAYAPAVNASIRLAYSG